MPPELQHEKKRITYIKQVATLHPCSLVSTSDPCLFLLAQAKGKSKRGNNNNCPKMHQIIDYLDINATILLVEVKN